MVRAATIWRRSALALAGVIGSAASTAACAAPEEIQVYIDDLNRVGGAGVDFHVNYVLTGDPATDYAEQQSSIDRLRVTPEFSYGVSEHIKLGLYLPLATYDRSGNFGLHGIKGRIKYIGSEPGALSLGRASGSRL